MIEYGSSAVKQMTVVDVITIGTSQSRSVSGWLAWSKSRQPPGIILQINRVNFCLASRGSAMMTAP